MVDSEASVADVEQTWTHLANQDGWSKPPGADDEQVLLMTTCMETWIVVDRPTLRKHFGSCLNENALPGDLDIESKSRDAILNALIQATRACKAGYAKGKKSFEILGMLDPEELRKCLPSFVRFERVLDSSL